MNNSIKWLKDNKESLSIRGINRQLNESFGFPLETLVKAVSGKRKLPKKWLTPLEAFIKTLKK